MSNIDSDIIEAGALLGAAINRYGTTAAPINPPKGTHSSFSILDPTPSSELMVCLHSLRSLLRSAPRDTPLVAAPSLLAGVLMKLLGISSNLASSASSAGDPTKRTAIPPMLSTPLRKLWVDCVVLCHVLGDGLSGVSRINVHAFLRNMMQLVAMNPKTARAAGGTRIAAIDAIAGIMKEEKLAPQISNWALDIAHLCQRALKSIGNGESTYRIAATNMACAAVIASRTAFLNTRSGANPLVLKGSLEDKAILELIRLLKIAVVDKYPEVRSGAATLACILPPLIIHTSIKSPNTPDAVAQSPTSSLEELMVIAMKHIDDESPMVASTWAEALARCITTAIEYNNILSAEKTSNRNVEGDDGSPTKTSSGSGVRGVRKGTIVASTYSNLPKSLAYLVDMFIKVGGELTPPRSGGGTFCVGGRALRNGLARTMIELLRLQSLLQNVGEGKSLSQKEAIRIILSMVGSNLETQLSSTTTPSQGNNLFGQSPKVSPADASLARLAASRVLREGISIMSPEAVQITILHELIHTCSSKNQSTLNGNQLQVALIETSHLVATLGEAASSAVEDLVPTLKASLRHPDQGVRHEAAVACAAVASIFPSRGRQLVEDTISDIQVEHAELVTTSIHMPTENAKDDATVTTRFARFRRQTTPTKPSKVDESAKHKHAIHGMALLISLLLRDLPNLPGGLPADLLDKSVSVAEILVNSLFNTTMTSSNPGGVCTCTRGGFAIICGAFATGITGITKHVSLLFALWQKVANEGQRGGSFTDAHELVCVEAMLESVVAFLRYCSELLLSVPDALSRTSLLLEDVLPLLFSDGRLGKTETIPAAAGHLDSAKAAVLEAFAWLPPGSYPMIADSVFGFAAANVQRAIEKDVSCSILRSLVSSEDVLLDATSFCRATAFGQAGGAQDLENDIITLKSEVASHNDRESVIHLLKNTKEVMSDTTDFHGSQVLGVIMSENTTEKAPTPLHEVGTWRRPAMPSNCAKVRLIDASIQAFAATFTLKSGKEQQDALQLLESLLPPPHLSGQRSTSGDQGRRSKSKDDTAAAVNICAVLLFCLKALPVFESTHNVPINLGPMWMNKAKNVFLGLLRSPSQEVRRAAAEGLGFLSTLGVREDARFLQSAILHDLDEVIQGTQDHEQGKALSLEAIAASRAAAVLALACMQRTASNIKHQREARAMERGSIERHDESSEDVLPLFQILIKILPSITIRPTGGFLGVRAVGLHSFGVFFAYSKKLEGKTPNAQESHLLKKLVELLEDNFLSAWTAASVEYDYGTDEDKLATETSFVAVLVRLMTLLIPSISFIEGFDPDIAMRFSRMAMIATECLGTHPTVKIEVLAFHEVLSQHHHLLPPHTDGVKYDEHGVLSSIPLVMESISPPRPAVHRSHDSRLTPPGMSSKSILRASLTTIRALSFSNILVAEWSGMKIVSLLFAALEDLVGTQTFHANTFHRGLAAPRESEQLYNTPDGASGELSQVMFLLALLERRQSSNSMSMLLRYILLSRNILLGSSSQDSQDDEDDQNQTLSVALVVQSALKRAKLDAKPLLEYANPPRWQVKILAVQAMTIALHEMSTKSMADGLAFIDSPVFNPKVANLECAKACLEATAQGKGTPDSYLSLHLGAIIGAACGMATATVDQAELRLLQETAMHLVRQVIECFGTIPDADQAGTTVLHDDLPHISSALKTALGAPSDDRSPVSRRLFLAGCQTLQTFLKLKVTTDRAVLKRFLRPVIPDSAEVPLFGIDERLPVLATEDSRSVTYVNNRADLLVHLGKLWTIGNIPKDDGDVLGLVTVDKAALGAHAGSLAIDGARLLLNEGLTLGGIKAETKTTTSASVGPRYLNDWQAIDDSVKAALATTWASLAASAVTFLMESMKSPGDHEHVVSWLRNIVPFMFAGFGDAVRARSNEAATTLISGWARSINPTDVAISCLLGITALSSRPDILALDDKWRSGIEIVLAGISSDIFDPILIGKINRISSAKDIELVRACCTFLNNLSNQPLASLPEHAFVLRAILHPISQLEESEVDLSGPQSGLIISACLIAVSKVIAEPSAPASLVEPLFSLTRTYLCEKKGLPPIVRESFQIVLKQILSHDSITVNDKSALAVDLIRLSDWGTWAMVVSADKGLTAEASLCIAQELLLECLKSDEPLPLLTAFRTLVQSSPVPSECTGRVICAVMGEVLSLFEAYGVLQIPTNLRSHRTTVCADGMKIALLAIQQFSSDGTSDEDIAQVLSLVLQSCIVVIRFNGLPNHPAPHPGSSDPALGRMCAQAVTHVARTAALPFKSSMGLLSDQDRMVLEFAVRAEMSGYVVAPVQAAPKKKLNLQSFKK